MTDQNLTPPQYSPTPDAQLQNAQLQDAQLQDASAAQPATMAPPAPAAMTTPPAPAQPASVPGRGLGIAGLILAILLPLVGLIVSIIARSQSKKAGVKNGPATAGIIVGAALLVLAIIITIVAVTASASLIGGAVEVCNELGTGVWEVDGVTYTCG